MGIPARILVIIVLGAILVGFGGIIGAGVYVLRPLDRAARRSKLPTQFTIVDFFSLTAHIAIPLGLIGAISTTDRAVREPQIMLTACCCVAATLIWWGTMKTASRAGITQGAKRTLMVAIVVPVTYVAAIIAAPLLMILLCQRLFGSAAAPFWLYVLDAASVAALIGCRKTVDWILAP